jgi:hypothetical protein
MAITVNRWRLNKFVYYKILNFLYLEQRYYLRKLHSKH